MKVDDLCRGIEALSGVAEIPLLDRTKICVMLRWPALASTAWSDRLERVADPIRGAGFSLGVNVGARSSETQVDEFVRQVAASRPDLLHLPERAASPALWRARLSQHVDWTPLIGRSCHDLVGLENAFVQGADYAWLSPIYATPSKPSAVALGTATLGLACQQLTGAVVALGGIDDVGAGDCLAVGAHGVACIRSAWGSRVGRLVDACFATDHGDGGLER